MIVRSFRLRQDNIKQVKSFCTENCIAVIRPEKPVENLFRKAVSRTIISKKPATEEFKAINAYFEALSDDPQYREKSAKIISDVASYLSQAMYVLSDVSAVEDYVLAKCARALSEAVADPIGASVVDGTELLVCREENGIPAVEWNLSREQIILRLKGVTRAVVPGGYGRLKTGYVVRLGRGGAHLMASLIAAALGAEVLESFIEADGVQGLPAITYDEMAHFCADNASAISPTALWPLRTANIPVRIKNIHNPAFAGTTVSSEKGPDGGRLFTGVISDSALSLITVYGTGLPGQIGMSSAIFSRLSGLGVNIRFIAQTSSEYSISFAVRDEDTEKTLSGLKGLFEGNPLLPMDDVLVQNKKAGTVTVFGDRMKNVPGVSARIYDTLGNAGISIIASAQGGEELSISMVLSEEDIPAAVELLKAL